MNCCPQPLTPREREVMFFVAKGFSAALVAGQLEMSEHTVNQHVKSIYKKLGIGSRAELGVQAVRLGVVSFD